MEKIISADGTMIAFDQLGAGPPLILVSGAMCGRAADAALAAALADEFTVLNYDRRGRGDSTDTIPYAVEREVEDLAAVLDAAGGSAVVVGLSSGGALALLAGAAGLPILRLVGWEIPYRTDDAGRRASLDYRARLDALLREGARGAAVELFMMTVGLPPQAIAAMKASPGWAEAEKIAPTLAYDAAVLGDSSVPEAIAGVSCATLLLTGGASPSMFAAAAEAAVALLPSGEHRILGGQRHDVAAEALAAAVRDFVPPRA